MMILRFVGFSGPGFSLSCWCYKLKTVQNLKWHGEILFCGHVVHGRRHTGEFCHIRFELIWNCWSDILLHACMHLVDLLKLQAGNVEEIADAELDYAGTYPLAT